MDPESIARPRPDARGAGKTYWNAAARGRIELPRCTDCGKLHWYPRVRCPSCGSAQLEWIAASGKGTVHTYTVVRHSADPYFKTRVPYVLAMIDLEEGVRLMSNVVDCDPADVKIGAAVSAVFERAAEDVGVPLFRLEGVRA